MRFDDRLSTVLRQSAEAPRDRAVQWRQLVELVARGAGESDEALLTRALGRIAEIAPEVPDSVRASAAQSIAAPDLPFALLRLFAADRGEIAAPLLDSAALDEARWDELRSVASAGTRALMDDRRPPGATARRARSAESVEQQRSPTADPPLLIHWECGPEGEIDWVDGAPRAALIGRSIRSDLRQRFDAMQPFVDLSLVLADDGSLPGEWRWSGEPQFTPSNGRFAGYAGIARRTAPTIKPRHDPVPAPPITLPVDHDNLRELIHELRTPLTAIIGFGEVIEGQYLGPAHRAYRDRAGEIVRQARLLLAAVEDLDLAAKLRSGRGIPATGTALSALAERIDPRVTVQLRRADVQCALEPALAERLLRRFVAAVADSGGDGEQLQLVVDQVDRSAVIAIDRPERTLELSENELLSTGSVANLGFALRLVRGLAQIVGGSLDIEPEDIVLVLPTV